MKTAYIYENDSDMVIARVTGESEDQVRAKATRLIGESSDDLSISFSEEYRIVGRGVTIWKA